MAVLDTDAPNMKSAHAMTDEARRQYTTLVETRRLRKLNELVSLTRKMRVAQRTYRTTPSGGSRQDAEEYERTVDDALAWFD